MAMNQLDKMRLLGVIKSTQINEYDDLYIETRSKLDIYDFLNTSIEIVNKLIKDSSNEKYILNAFSAVLVILIRMLKGDLFDISYEDFLNIEKLTKIEDNFSKEIEDKICDIKFLLDKIKEKCSFEEEVAEESIMVDVTEEMDALETQVAEYTAQIKSLNAKMNKLERETTNREKREKELVEERKRLKQELTSTKKVLKKLEDKYQTIKSSYDKLVKEVEEKSKSLERSENEKNTYKKNIETYKRGYEIYCQTEEEVKKYNEIQYIILDTLSKKRATAKDLYRIVREKGIKCRPDEVLRIIKDISDKYSISDTVLIDFEKSYIITPKSVREGQVFEMSKIKRKMRFLLISDTHFSMMHSVNVALIEKLLDYALFNGIEVIINNGDLLAYDYLSESDKLNRMEYNDRILNSTIENYPYDSRITNLILGGNHDVNILRYGIDPLDILEKSRNDFHSLGYNSAYFRIASDLIGFYHPKFRFVDDKNDELCQERLSSYLLHMSEKDNISLDDLYLSFFGHFHMSKEFENIVLCPSIARDRYSNGAWDVTIHTNSKGIIECVNLTKLKLGRSLVKQDELEYTRRIK